MVPVYTSVSPGLRLPRLDCIPGPGVWVVPRQPPSPVPSCLAIPVVLCDLGSDPWPLCAWVILLSNGVRQNTALEDEPSG